MHNPLSFMKPLKSRSKGVSSLYMLCLRTYLRLPPSPPLSHCVIGPSPGLTSSTSNMMSMLNMSPNCDPAAAMTEAGGGVKQPKYAPGYNSGLDAEKPTPASHDRLDKMVPQECIFVGCLGRVPINEECQHPMKVFEWKKRLFGTHPYFRVYQQRSLERGRSRQGPKLTH